MIAYNGHSFNFRLRGEDGRFVGFNSLNDVRYSIVVDKSNGFSRFSQFGIKKKDILRCLDHLAETMNGLDEREIKLSRAKITSFGKGSALVESVNYRVEVSK